MQTSASSAAKTLRPLPWLQLPLCLGLIVAQAVYMVQVMSELYHLVFEMKHAEMEVPS